MAGRKVLVVGAGTRRTEQPDPPVSIGRAIAWLAAREGASVACVNRTLAGATETAEVIAAEGLHAVALAGDVNSPGGLRAASCRGGEGARLGGLDGGLALNVGENLPGVAMADYTPQTWDDFFTTNVRGQGLILQAALPHMPPGSSVVFTSSVAAHAGTGMVGYDVTKAGLEALMRHVASAYGPGGDPLERGRAARDGRHAGVARDLKAATAMVTPDLYKHGVALDRLGTGWDVAYATVFPALGEVARSSPARR